MKLDKQEQYVRRNRIKLQLASWGEQYLKPIVLAQFPTGLPPTTTF